MEQILKQRICIEFCVKLQISATETFEMLNKAFPNDAPKRTTVFEWHSRFKAGRISIEDDPRQGRPKFQRADENVQKITDLIKENPRTTLLELEQDTGISKTTIGRIVTEDLKLKKTPAKFIPRFLTNEQKLCRLATCEDMMKMTRTDPEWKDKIITGDETWVYGYDPETKPQSAEWRDIAPNDFFLFPKLKAVLKGRHFDNRDDIIEKSPLALKSIPKEAYKNCFENWEKRWRWFDSRLPQLITRVDEVLQESTRASTHYYRESTGSQHITESRQDNHNEGDHNEEAEQTIPKQETTLEEEETSPPQDTSADPLTQIADALSKLLVARSPREIDVSPYDGTFEAQSFFDNFDAQTDRTELTYTDRLRKLPCYLQATTEASFARFLAIKLTPQMSIENYYQNKTVMGMKLDLPADILIESLTDGLPVADQRLVATVQPNTIKEWFDLVSRITQCATSAVNQRQVDKAPHPTYHNPPPRYNNQRPSRVTYPVTPPPSPCKYCNAMHWHSQCEQRFPRDQTRPVYSARPHTTTVPKRGTHTQPKVQPPSHVPQVQAASQDDSASPASSSTTRNLDTINAIKPPTNQKTLQSFLGAVNVYNKFIADYARLRAPLNKLLKKDVKWNWNPDCQQAFTTLKESLTSKPVLHLYQVGLPCRLYCDASTQGIAGILKQVHPDGQIHPVQYFSRALRAHERNYTVSELECLAIVESVDKFRIYLTGIKFTIYTDHQALQWLKTIKNPSGRLFRWSLRLSTYNYEIHYIKGSQQYEADLLSRNPFVGFISTDIIKQHQPTASPFNIDTNGLHTIIRKGVTKIIIPETLQHTLMNKVHQEYNHPGIITTQYYWKGISKSIEKFVRSCHTCQIIKRPKGKPYGALGQIPPPQQPFDLISIDTIAGFSKYGHSKTYLHVIVDHLTRYAWTFPSKSTSTLTYIQTLKTVLQQGSPKRLLSDRAPAFTSEKFRKFLIMHGIQPLLTTSNNPQANGLIERLNATITGKLRLAYLENPKASWTQLVKRVTQTYNNTPHSVTSFPPTYLMFNVIPPDLRTHLNPYPEINIAREIASSRTQNKHKKDKETFDKQHRTPHFEENDLVLVKNYRHPDTGKLAPYFTGPYKIIEIISPNVVRIDRPNQPLNRDSDTIHVNKLKYYTEDVLYITPPQPRFVQHPQRLPQDVYFIEFNHLNPDIFETQLFRIIPPTSSQPFLHLNPSIFN
ncbi:hypothetical protein LAZ67_2003444 [Cordylochernes scorpioides]|uniref:RNA-directed DNA polymerase n=1 Tax=Cordylochernes scorpioides TaxID=51811 RepID=A0ABY6K3Q2_9ARAC|nr:hypothetical protein LAZ67_2003444 [Cordylochernes scorpioides]